MLQIAGYCSSELIYFKNHQTSHAALLSHLNVTSWHPSHSVRKGPQPEFNFGHDYYTKYKILYFQYFHDRRV